MKKRGYSLFLLGLITLSLVGCGKKEVLPPPEPDVPVIAEPTPPPPPPPPYVPSGTNPLTGLPMEEKFENNRPVAVMLNNLRAAQPQLGTSMADIIYEVPAEGGITRMLAVYQTLDGVGNLGSIRSARPYYMELALGHDALYVHAGGSPDAYADIQAWDMDNMDGVNGGSDAEIFWRDAARRKTAGYEHSMLTSGENILGYADHFRTERRGDYPQMFSAGGATAGGTAAEHVTLRFSEYKTGKFDYDPAMGQYLVRQYGEEYIDGNTGEQLGVTNLLVLNTSISVISGDTAGRLAVKLTGDGKGSYFCEGKSIPIHWSKADRNSPLVYTTEGGGALTLKQGNSYVCIITPRTSTLTVE
ncbi:MAG: DUF3048 domain-containing protein [Oscillibacter sp.]